MIKFFRLTLISFVMYFGMSACTSLPEVTLDPPVTETLKQRISKARNAIIETRLAIARAQGAVYIEELMIRLAELLSEEAQAHYLVARAEAGSSNKALQVPQVKTLKQQSIDIYTEFLEKYPKSNRRARVLFNMGQEYRELGEYDNMRRTLDTLLLQYPTDTLSAEALLILGDDAFDRGKFNDAKIRYDQLLQGNDHPLKGLAFYKQAWVYVNLADCKQALPHFEKAITETQRLLKTRGTMHLKGQYTSIDVRREALVDMMYCFSQERAPKGAVKVIRELAYDRPSLIAALEKLRARYEMKSELPEGRRDISRALIDYGPDGPKRLNDATDLYTALKEAKDYTHIGDDVKRINAVMRRASSAPQLANAERTKLVGEFERLTRDLAVTAQDALDKRFGTTKYPNEKIVDEAEKAYISYLNTYPDAQARPDILSNLALLYQRSGQDFKAGQRFYQRAFSIEKDKGGLEDAYQALTHYQKALDQSGLSQHQRVIARAGIRKAGARLLSGTLSPEQNARVRYSIAQTFYNEGRLDEAIIYLEAVVTEFPTKKQGVIAARLLLDAYNQQGDYLGLVKAGERLTQLPLPVDLNADVTQLMAQAKQKQLDQLALEAAGVDGGDVTSELEDLANEHAGTDLGERALLNAFVAARAKLNLESMDRILKQLTSQYPKSSQLTGAYSSFARTATSFFDTNTALTAYEKAAQLNPSQTTLLLGAAAQLQAKLGNEDQAIEILKRALKDQPATEESPSRILLTELLIKRVEATKIQALLPQNIDIPTPSIAAGIGYSLIAQGRYDEAEEQLQFVLSADTNVNATLMAIALYAQAEVNYALLREFKPEATIEDLGEWVLTLELAEQSYLKAARSGHPLWGSASLNRLAHLSVYAANQMSNFPPPTDIPSSAQKRLEKSYKVRISDLKKQSNQAMQACKELAWKRGIVPYPVQQCLNEQKMDRPSIPTRTVKGRTTQVGIDVGRELRVALAKNEANIEAMMQLGEAFIDAGDPHLARLVLSRVLQGGGPEALNLYGVACAMVEDWSGALEGFSRAAINGLEVAKENSKKIFKTLGLDQVRSKVDQQWSADQSGGRKW